MIVLRSFSIKKEFRTTKKNYLMRSLTKDAVQTKSHLVSGLLTYPITMPTYLCTLCALHQFDIIKHFFFHGS